jgi:hypothetical protein
MSTTNGNNAHGNGDVTIRRLGEADLAQVLRLAELDSAAAPKSPLVGIEVGGRLLAAGSVPTGQIIADPFRPTAGLREMLSAALAAPW